MKRAHRSGPSSSAAAYERALADYLVSHGAAVPRAGDEQEIYSEHPYVSLKQSVLYGISSIYALH